MIVRESPKSRVQKDQPSWPPKSPREALLSSPSGRRKYEQRQLQRRSVSPSPIKRRPLSRGQPDLEDDDEEEEDEETLQLKLQAIEARLKLKKLQRSRKGDGETDSVGASSRPGTSASLRRVELSKPQSEVQVPVSPTRNRREPQEQKSPARVILGIDKGLRAADVSLKRATSYSARGRTHNTSGLSRANSTRQVEEPRSKSFSERIAESRNKDKEREEKQSRIEKSRSGGFGLRNIEGLKDRPASRAGSALSAGTKNSQDTTPSTRTLDRAQSRSVNDLRSTATPRPGSNLSARTDYSRAPSAASQAPSRGFVKTATASKYHEISERDDSTDGPSFESFSGLHLKSREMQHTAITRTLEGKTILTIPQLLKTVKAPDYEPPDMENDYVVMGVIASKSDPRNTKNAVREQSAGNQDTSANPTNKFMVIRLTDLKWELDLFLFDTGFSRFWKLSEGTLIAILNPDIMPPRNRDTGKFSLKLSSSDDTVLEIGLARDLDFCHAKRKDGKECTQWIDGRKTEFCDFHIELQVEKSKRGRMEVNTMTGFGKGPSGGKRGMFGGGSGGGRGGGGGGWGRGGGLKSDDRTGGQQYDHELHETYYITPSAGGATKLMDQDEQPWERGASRAERHRKQLAEKEKERELAKRLGEIGSGAGGDYMRRKGADTPGVPSRRGTPAEDPFITRKEQTANVDPLGLIGKKADDVSLAPVKRKRMLSGKSTASSEPVGWGGAFKRGLLLSPKKETTSSLRDTRETSPAKKKARLLLPEKGIREPGRESLGTLDVGLIAAMDEDDDDLEVV